MNKTCIIDVSVIFVNYNATDMLIEAIRSVMQHTREARYEIIVVDNASPDGGAQSCRMSSANASTSLKATVI